MKFTNNQKIGLSTAVFLAHDSYDHDHRPNAVSATGFLKSTRQTILSSRVDAKIKTMDISQLIASSFGTAVHDGVEAAWLHGNHIGALRKLGYPEDVIARVTVNHGYVKDKTGNLVKDPNADPLPDNAIPVYTEIRSERELDGIIITGKFDFVGDGELEDHKTTGVFTYMKKTNDEKYRIQGSIYRWLNQDIITSDRLVINYTFTDWAKIRSMVEAKQGYPPYRMMSVPFTLMPIKETEEWLKGRIREITAYMKKDERDIPLCTQEELWQDATVYKYYKNPSVKTRATKNFDNFAEAQSRLLKDGSVGCVDIIPGKAKACLYCNAAPVCSQARQLVLDGSLEMDL